MNREEVAAARCTVERLMRLQGLCGVRIGKVVSTTSPDKPAHCPLDLVNLQFNADRPNQLWFLDVSNGRAGCSHSICKKNCGCRVNSSMRTEFVLDAFEQALSIVSLSDKTHCFITSIVDHKMYQFGVEKDGQKLTLSPLLAAAATATTTLWQKSSTCITRLS